MIKFDSSSLVADIRSLTAKIEAGLGERTLRRVGFAGAEVFREQAKRNAIDNVKTGTLYRNIIAKRVEEDSDGGNRQVYLVTVRSGKFNEDGDAFYWRFVEDGHKFVPRNKRVSAKTGKTIGWAAHRRAADKKYSAEREGSKLEFGTSKVPAYPFMRPAYESKKAEAIKVMQDKLGQEVSKAIGGGE